MGFRDPLVALTSKVGEATWAVTKTHLLLMASGLIRVLTKSFCDFPDSY